MRTRQRNNQPLQALFPLALTAFLLLLSSVFSSVIEHAVAQTEASGLSCPAASLVPISSCLPYSSDASSLTWETSTSESRLVSSHQTRHHLAHGNPTRNTYRRYIVMAADLPSPPAIVPDLTCTTPLLVLEIHLVAQASLCYHHSGRSPPTLL